MTKGHSRSRATIRAAMFGSRYIRAWIKYELSRGVVHVHHVEKGKKRIKSRRRQNLEEGTVGRAVGIAVARAHSVAKSAARPPGKLLCMVSDLSNHRVGFLALTPTYQTGRRSILENQPLQGRPRGGERNRHPRYRSTRSPYWPSNRPDFCYRSVADRGRRFR